MQFNSRFCIVVELRTFKSDSAMGPIWGQNEAPSLARLLRCSDLGREGVECGDDVVELIIEKICVRVGSRRLRFDNGLATNEMH